MKPLFDTIQQTQALPPGQDYAQLRTEGLALVQELSGELWTDYNLHDPGVTLLEALCYVLTDLSSRASQPIPNLLAVSVDTPVPTDALVPAHEAFANHRQHHQGEDQYGDGEECIYNARNALVKKAALQGGENAQ